jgi:sugar phosphate isomerase/epimerase
MTSRRNFLKSASAATIWSAGVGSSVRAYAQGLNLPLGLQLYSVRELLPVDFDGTLRKIGGLGYREVEAAGFYQHDAKDVKRAMHQANLKCVSGHYPSDTLHQNFQAILDFHKELGAEYIICSSPGFRTPKAGGNGRALTMDDWRWNADEFNSFGAKASAVGLKFGYHNHIHEFAITDGMVPYVELIKRTDPSHVTLELDCGWVIVAGASPQEYLHKYPSRITMLHVKDFKRPSSLTAGADAYKPTELGRGFIDYGPIFEEAAKANNIKHIFVEQEGFDVPAEESLRIDAEYVRKFQR